MRIVFMGTPDFAVPSLKKLAEQPWEIVAVVTQPDRPRGRGKKVTPSPVKEVALGLGLPVYQPERVRNPEFIKLLQDLSPDVIIVVAFGQILPREILFLPVYGCINLHASLLPKYRGAAPIHWSVINGETTTGVTTMMMDEGLDTGDMLLKKEIPISDQATTGEIHDQLAEVGANLLVETIRSLPDGCIVPQPQDETKASYAPMLTKELEEINWEWPVAKIYNLIRGMNPWPGTYTFYKDKILKIWRAERIGSTKEPDRDFKPGQIISVLNKGPVVQTGDGQIILTELQPQGKSKMKGEEFVRGYQVYPGLFLVRETEGERWR